MIHGFRHQHPADKEPDCRFHFFLTLQQVRRKAPDPRQSGQRFFLCLQHRLFYGVQGQESRPALFALLQIPDGLLRRVRRLNHDILCAGAQCRFHRGHILRFHGDQRRSRPDHVRMPAFPALHDRFYAEAEAFQGLLHIPQQVQPGFHRRNLGLAFVVFFIHVLKGLTFFRRPGRQFVSFLYIAGYILFQFPLAGNQPSLFFR